MLIFYLVIIKKIFWRTFDMVSLIKERISEACKTIEEKRSFCVSDMVEFGELICIISEFEGDDREELLEEYSKMFTARFNDDEAYEAKRGTAMWRLFGGMLNDVAHEKFCHITEDLEVEYLLMLIEIGNDVSDGKTCDNPYERYILKKLHDEYSGKYVKLANDAYIEIMADKAKVA